MVATINNGHLAKKPFVILVKKKVCENILNVLWDEGFILGYKNLNKNSNSIQIFLKYKNGDPVISFLKILSKPSMQIYYSVKQLWKLKFNEGVVIISTNKGFLTHHNCKKQNIGGEPMILIK
jgi:small subunit ribosomal protein S8